MADARLGIQISADVANLVSGMNQGSKSVASLEGQLTNLQKSLSGQFKVPFAATGLDKLKADIADAKNNISSFSVRPITLTGDAAKQRVEGIIGANVKINADTSQLQFKVEEIRADINSLTANATLGINAGDFEAKIKSITDKLASLTDARLNISADPAQAEAAIKGIVSDLDNLRNANVILRADGTQAIKIIDTIEGQLQSLQANISVDASGIQAKAAEIKEAFGRLDFTANVGVNETVVNDAIKSINEKLSLLADPTIDFTANPLQAENAIREINGLLAGLKDANVSLSVSGAEAVESFISEIQSDLIRVREAANIPLLLSDEIVKAKISDLKNQLATISSSTKIGADTTEFDAALKTVQSKIAALDAPDIDLTANKEQVEAALKDISDDLGRLKGSTITLDANGRPAIKSINELEKELQDLERQLKQSTNPTDLLRLGKAANLVREQIKGINSSGLQSSLGKVSKSGNEASQTLINLSRVAQDAPFGFLGIANNLNPLVESFQRLQVASKQTGTSLASNLGSALSGAGGIGLAVGVVSSLLITFGDKLLSSSKAASELTIESGKLELQLKSLADGFDDVQKASDFLNRLGNVIVDINFGQGSLSGGLLKLQGEIVQNLFNENDLKKRLGEVTDLFSRFNPFEDLSQNARDVKEQFGRALLIPESVLSELSQQDQSLLKQEAGFQKSIEDLNNKLTGLENERTVLAAQVRLQRVLIAEDEAKKLKELQDKQKADFEKFVNDTISRAKQFAKEFGNAFVVPELDESFFVDKNQIFKRAKTLLKNVKTGDLIIKLPVKFGIASDSDFIFNLDDLKPPSDKTLEELTKGFFETLEKKQEPFVFDASIQVAINKENALKELEKKIESLAESARQSVINAFQGFGEAIGNALSGQGADDIFTGFLNVLGAGIKAIGQQIVALSVAAIALKKALKALLANPGLALAAGVAFIAIGTAISNIKPKGFAGGGFVRGPGGPKEDKIPALLSNGEFVVNAAAVKKNFSLLQAINSGLKLPKFADGGIVSFPSVSVNLPTTLRSFIQPPSQPQVILLNSRVRGRDQVLQMSREQRSQRLRR